MFQCNICLKRVLRQARKLACAKCHNKYHLKCLHLVDAQSSIYINRHNNVWFCECCVSEALPFNHIFEDEDYYDALSSMYDCNHVFNHLISNQIFSKKAEIFAKYNFVF